MQTTLFTSYNDTRTITIYLMKYCGMKQNKNDKYIFPIVNLGSIAWFVNVLMKMME